MRFGLLKLSLICDREIRMINDFSREIFLEVLYRYRRVKLLIFWRHNQNLKTVVALLEKPWLLIWDRNCLR